MLDMDCEYFIRNFQNQTVKPLEGLNSFSFM